MLQDVTPTRSLPTSPARCNKCNVMQHFFKFTRRPHRDKLPNEPNCARKLPQEGELTFQLQIGSLRSAQICVHLRLCSANAPPYLVAVLFIARTTSSLTSASRSELS